MAIKLQCACGKTLGLPDHLAGEKIRCKDCGKVMTVPRPSAVTAAAPAAEGADDPLAVRGHVRCSQCGRSYPQTDTVCTKCGINLHTGAALYVSMDPSSEASDEGAARAPSARSRPGFFARLLRLVGIRRGP